jgi:uncharacterized protein
VKRPDLGWEKYCTPEFAFIAAEGTILRAEVGSGLHGITVEGQGDRDEMGITIEPAAYVIGLRQFDQYQERGQPRSAAAQPGDLELTVFGLRKWMRLALAGNPHVLQLLFAPAPNLVTIDHLGRDLRAAGPGFILSRQAGGRFLGALKTQRDSLLSYQGKGRDVTRPHLVEAYGWDVKYGFHMVRLGLQGAELMETGRIRFPVPEPWRTWLRELRTGGHTMTEALNAAAMFEERITAAIPGSPLPEQPDRDAADQWLVYAYTNAWEARRFAAVAGRHGGAADG